MDRLKRSHILEELTGKVHLTQYEAVSSINPDLARRTLEAQKINKPRAFTDEHGAAEPQPKRIGVGVGIGVDAIIGDTEKPTPMR